MCSTPQYTGEAVSLKKLFLIGGVFYLLFLLLTPLGLFNNWIPPLAHSGHYSVKIVDGGDDIGYYSYLRSIFFDGDVDFIDERYYAHINRFNSSGYVFSNWQLGQAILYLPFFLSGHLLALLYGALGYPIKADGYSSPYFIATAIASSTYLFVGLMIMSRVLKKIVDERIAVVASISLWMASPLLYYTFIRQRMAHTTEFFLATLFIMAWLNYRNSNNKYHHAVIGASLGLLCLVRLINAHYGVLYIVDMAFLYFAGRNSVNSTKGLDFLTNVLCFVALFLVLLSPQLVAWNQLNGSIISSYLTETLKSQAIETSTSSVMFGSKLYDLFFSAKWGLAVATPLWFAGLIGFFISGPVSRGIRFASLSAIVSLILVMLSFVESDAYGNRYFISAAVLFTIGLANLLHRFLSNKITSYITQVFIVACVISQYFMIVQYKVILDYNHPNFSIEALSRSFNVFLEHPLLLLRSTNFFRLMSFDNTEWNYLDGMYLLIFPLAQFVCVVGVLFLFKSSMKSGFVLKIIARPKNIILIGILSSMTLVSLIINVAPDKSIQEIEKRMTYKQLLSSGESFLAKRDYKSAQISFDQASLLMPNLWTPYFMKATIFVTQKKFVLAKQEYSKAIEIFPDHPSILANYGATLGVLGESEKAVPFLKAAIRQLPNNYNAYNSLAQVYLSQQKPKKARDMLLLAIMVNPGFGQGHANLANIYVIMKDSEKARIHLKKALELGFRNSKTESLKKILQNSIQKNKN